MSVNYLSLFLFCYTFETLIILSQAKKAFLFDNP